MTIPIGVLHRFRLNENSQDIQLIRLLFIIWPPWFHLVMDVYLQRTGTNSMSLLCTHGTVDRYGTCNLLWRISRMLSRLCLVSPVSRV